MHHYLLAIVLTFSCILPMPNATGADWPRWMGPDGDGVWREQGILESLPDSKLKVAWRVPIGGGYSGPAVAENRLFTMDFVGREKTEEEQKNNPGGVPGVERIVCFNASTGDEEWSHSYETVLKIGYPGGPRSTPTVEEDRVYTLGSMGKLICFRAATGEIVWSIDLTEAYDTRPPLWGYASHPLILDDLLICGVGGEGTGLVAFDKLTGKEVWRSITAQEIGYAPPVLAELAGREQLVVWFDVALAGLDPKSGEELWRYDFPVEQPKRPVVSIVPPLVVGNRIFISNYYHGSALVEVTQEGVQEVWTTEKSKGHRDDINTIMSTLVYTDECFVGVSGNGDLRCVRAEDASLVWQDYHALATEEEDPEVMPRGTNGFAAMFMTPHNDRYWMFSDQGDLIVAKLSQDGYEELGRQKVLETTGETRGRTYVWCPPAYANGHMYVRNEKELICVDLRAASYQ